MGVIEELGMGISEGRKLASADETEEFHLAERHIFEYGRETDDSIAIGDNLKYMKWLIRNGYAGSFKVIYIDPPFFTKAKYDASVDLKDADGGKYRVRHLAYDDIYDRSLENYIKDMSARLILMKELLADDGLIWVHLDWHSSHYIKIIMDEVFGEKNFQNEIIWKYKSGGTGKRHFSRKHDTLLVYSKTKKYYLDVPKERSYNRGLKPYRFKGVKEYRDEYGWYTMVNMKDVWSLDMVGRTSGERNGYATQKPLELMNRIIEASSVEGDLCGDFFCGSGSFIEAAERLGRKWRGCDREEIAVGTVKKRMDEISSNYCFYKSGDDEYHSGAEVALIDHEDLESGKKLYRFKLKKFDPDIDYHHISSKDEEHVRALSESDPFAFIDYIMIDTGYDGDFAAEMTVMGGYDSIRFISNGNIAFIVVDVFGKEYLINGDFY